MKDSFFDELDKNDVGNYRKNEINNSSKNVISVIIKILCWMTIIIGFIIGIVNYSFNENISQMITSWFIYFGCSIGGFALAEIIQILHDIRNKLYSGKK